MFLLTFSSNFLGAGSHIRAAYVREYLLLLFIDTLNIPWAEVCLSTILLQLLCFPYDKQSNAFLVPSPLSGHCCLSARGERVVWMQMLLLLRIQATSWMLEHMPHADHFQEKLCRTCSLKNLNRIQFCLVLRFPVLTSTVTLNTASAWEVLKVLEL